MRLACLGVGILFVALWVDKYLGHRQGSPLIHLTLVIAFFFFATFVILGPRAPRL